MAFYEYRHVVGFAETNLVGNVYYVHYLSWQGRCREMFLREHCPELIDELSRDLAMVTTHCSCDFLAELFALDEVIVRMRLTELSQNRIAMGFEYWRRREDQEELVARGEQQVACMRRRDGRMTPAPLPDGLRTALEAYRTTPC
jgi:enediyne biosynthesis thioesterase